MKTSNDKIYLEELDVFKMISENKLIKPYYIFNFKDKMKQVLNKSKNISYKTKNDKTEFIQKKPLCYDF